MSLRPINQYFKHCKPDSVRLTTLPRLSEPRRVTGYVLLLLLVLLLVPTEKLVEELELGRG